MADLLMDLTVLVQYANLGTEDKMSREKIAEAHKRLKDHLILTAAWPEQKSSMAAELRVLETQLSWLAEKLEE